MRNGLMRIHLQLEEEIRRLSEKNDVTLIEASKLAAEILKNFNNKKVKIIEEITF